MNFTNYYHAQTNLKMNIYSNVITFTIQMYNFGWGGSTSNILRMKNFTLVTHRLHMKLNPD